MARKRKAIKAVEVAPKVEKAAGEVEKETELNSDSETIDGKEEIQLDTNNANSKENKKKKPKVKNQIVRRSGRLRSLRSSNQSKDAIVAHVDLVDNEMAEEQPVDLNNNGSEEDAPANFPGGENDDEPHTELVSKLPATDKRTWEEKVDYLVQNVEELNSKVSKGYPLSTDLSTDFNYKTLYIDSQKKVDALMEENQQLSRKLEFALGKIEAFEQMKDVLLASALGKTSDRVAGGSSVLNTAPEAAAEPKACPPSEGKKYKNRKKKA